MLIKALLTALILLLLKLLPWAVGALLLYWLVRSILKK